MPSLERILTAARNDMLRGSRQPHHFRAFEQGKGYVNNGSDPATRADYLRQLGAVARMDYVGWAPAYAPQQTDQPKRGVVMADWNVWPQYLDTILERAGYAVEWDDEYSLCDDCAGAVQTQPDSYGWTPEYSITDSGFLCSDCATANKPSDDENDDESEREA